MMGLAGWVDSVVDKLARRQAARNAERHRRELREDGWDIDDEGRIYCDYDQE